tara:strand:+ start:563 stop:6883 length:6321 start_codon:yes stop_codon:yes gene_type:complete
MDVIMRMNMTASRRLDTGPDTVDPVVFRHLGALDGCFDFQRYPPRWLPPCEVRRGLYAWVRRISDAEQKRNERAYFAARRRAREQLQQWAHNFTAHHVALRVAENATAVVRTIFHSVIALSCAATYRVQSQYEACKNGSLATFTSDVYDHVRHYLDCVRECLDAAGVNYVMPVCAWPYRFARWPLLELLVPMWVKAYKHTHYAATMIAAAWKSIVGLSISAIILLYRLPAILRNYGSSPVTRCLEYTRSAGARGESNDVAASAMRIISEVTMVEIRMAINRTIDYDPNENAIIFFASRRLRRLGILLGRMRVADSMSKLFDREADYWYDQAQDGGPVPTQFEMYKCYAAMLLAQMLSAAGRLLELVVVTTIYIPLHFLAASIGYLTAVLAAVQVVLLAAYSVNPTLAEALVCVCVASTSWVIKTRRTPNYIDLVRNAYRRLLPYRQFITFAGFCALTEMVRAAPSEKGMACPIFDGTSMLWRSWYITFTGWLAWKNPKLIDLINLGEKSCPTPADWNRPTDDEKAEIEAWGTLNVQYYGSILMHMSDALKISLHTAAKTDGCGSMQYLMTRFGANTTGDRTEATARLQRSYFDPRATLSVDDVTRQYNEICQAAADILASGGQPPDSEYLISLFENAMPPSYSHIRQMLRFKNHSDFQDYFDELLGVVKAEVKSLTPEPLGAFAAQSGNPGNTKVNPSGNSVNSGMGTNPCFNCGSLTHTRDKCPEPKIKCKHCGGGHMPTLCPKGPGSSLRDSLSSTAKRALARSVSSKSKGKERAHLANAEMAAADAMTAEDMMLAAQFKAFRAGKAARTSPGAGPSNAPPPQPPPPAQVAPDELVPPDEMEDFMSAIGRSKVMVALRRDQCPNQIAHVAMRSGSNIETIACVDSQASTFVVPSTEYLLRITDAKPSVPISTANGETFPEAIGVAGISLIDEDGNRHYFEIDGVVVLPQCDRVLYSWPEMVRCDVKHFLDDGFIMMPNGGKVPIMPGLSVRLSFGPPPQSAHPANIKGRRIMDHEGVPIDDGKPATGRGSNSAASVPQSLMWQRLGFPSEHAWRHSREVLTDHGLPSSTQLRSDFGVVDAVARARARALPFHKLRDPTEIPAPGSTIYTDFAGPMCESYPHKFSYYCGVVDAGSGYSRLFACHGPTKEVAKRSLERLLADMSSLMGLTHTLKPQVLYSDQGTAFMSTYFSDFLADVQIRHAPSAVYTPAQNSYVERMWGTRFSMARALLAHANLGPSWHPWALQTANWICNRLPQPSRGNLSPYFILARSAASVAYLRTFGCLVRVLVPTARRDGDRHFADRGQLGISLGPSEQCSGTCVYVPSKRSFVVSREVAFYEDTLPGVKGVDAAWRDVQSGDEGAGDGDVSSPSNYSSPSDFSSSPSSTYSPMSASPPLSAPSPSTSSSSSRTMPPVTTPPAPATPVSPPLPPPPRRPVSRTPNPPSPAFEVAPTIHEPDDVTTVGSNDGLGSSVDHRSGRHFQRDLGPHPVKRERKPATQYDVTSFKGKSYACNYSTNFTDPTTADEEHAINNFELLDVLSWTSQGPPSFAYEGSVGGLRAYKAVQASVATDVGDVPIPKGYRQALKGRWADYWKAAITKELNGLISRGTWHNVFLDELPKDVNIMGCHMVFTVKRLSDGTIEKFKCRLVANGNTQREGIDFDRIFSTVVKITTIRVVLVIAAARDYNLSSIDVQQAFLQGKLSEDLYMSMPPGLPSRSPDGRRLVVKLDRSLYGLKQAGRVWWQLFTEFIISWGFTQSSIDVCLYTYTSASGAILWLLVWVDDTIIVDNDEGLRERFVADLGNRFPIDDKHELEWILGVKVCRDRALRSLSLSQELYVRDLCKRHAGLIAGLTKKFDSPADPNAPLSMMQCPAPNSADWERMQQHRADYMALVGAFLWLANVTRPELAFIASHLARFVSNPGDAHYSAAIRVLLYLQGSASRTLDFKPVADKPLRVFVDSDWAAKFSVSGAVFEFMGCAVHWLSKVQRSVSLSSTEAEWFAAMVAAREGLYFRDLLVELGIKVCGPTALRSDNKSVKELSVDSVAFKKTKHILRAAYFLRDLCDRLHYKVVWIAGTQNPADLFTKVHSVSTFRAYVALLDNIRDIE